MRILISRGAYYGFGGAEISARDQAVVLRELGHESYFLTNVPDLRRDLQAAGVPVYRSLWAQKYQGILRYLNFFFVFPLMFVQYLVLVWRIKPDIINPHSREDQIVFTLLKGLHGRPVVWKDPGDFRYLAGEGRSRFGRWLERLYVRALRQADAIYVLNDEDRELMAGYAGGDERISVVPSSLLFRFYDLEAEPLPKSRPVVGAVIRLEDTKGVQHLITAARGLMTELDFEVWIVGDGSYRAELETLAEGEPRIRFLGQQAEVSSYYRSFDIFVQPADFEGWGRTIKEAAYFGLPIIGTDAGGVGLQIEDGKTGLLFAPRDPIDLARQLKRVLTDSELSAKLGRNAKAWALKEGDFTRIVEERILPIYERTIQP